MELILLCACAFILVFNLFMALVRGVRKSLLRLGTVVVAAVAAFLLAPAIAGKCGTEVTLWLQATVGANTDFAPLFEGAASAGDAIALFVKMLLAPAVFLVLYIVLKGILILVYWILANATRPPHRDTVKNRFAALPLGLVIGLIGVLVLICPLFGYLDLASEAIAAADKGATGESVAELTAYRQDLIEPAKGTPVISALYNTVGVHVFEGLSGGEWQESEVHLRTELTVLADIVGNLRVLGGKQPEQYGEAECAAIDAVARDVGSSHVLSVLCAGVLNTASNHWLSGTTFIGVPKPDMGSGGNELLHAFLEVFSTSREENLGQDLDFFSDVFALLVKYQIFEDIRTADDAALAELITNGDFLKDARALLATHPRMEPVGTALVDVGMRSALRAMGLPENIKQVHGELLSDMTTALQEAPVREDGTIDDAALAATLTDVFSENEIEVNDATVQLVAQGVAEHFTPQELHTLTVDEITQKLAERFGEVNVSDLVASQGAE